MILSERAGGCTPTAVSSSRAPVRPFLKWAGGKQALASTLTPLFPPLSRRTYREPFLGGGAMFFHLRPPSAVLSDALADLVATYRVVQQRPDELLARLLELEHAHSAERYYEVRERFNLPRRPRSAAASDLERATWLVYLNRTCYNGLFRTNQAGKFNVPVGRYEAPRIADAARLHAASEALAGAELRHASFGGLLGEAEKNDFVYLDPPYVPLSATSSFSAAVRPAPRGNATVATAAAGRQAMAAQSDRLRFITFAPMVRQV